MKSMIVLMMMAVLACEDGKSVSPDPKLSDMVSLMGLKLTDAMVLRHMDGYNFAKPENFDEDPDVRNLFVNNFNHTVTYQFQKGILVNITLWIQPNGWQKLKFIGDIGNDINRNDSPAVASEKLKIIKLEKDNVGWVTIKSKLHGKGIWYNWDENAKLYSIQIVLND